MQPLISLQQASSALNSLTNKLDGGQQTDGSMIATQADVNGLPGFVGNVTQFLSGGVW